MPGSYLEFIDALLAGISQPTPWRSVTDERKRRYTRQLRRLYDRLCYYGSHGQWDSFFDELQDLDNFLGAEIESADRAAALLAAIKVILR